MIASARDLVTRSGDSRSQGRALATALGILFSSAVFGYPSGGLA